MVLQIIEHEDNARLAQLEKKPNVLFNHIGRAYGILSHAHSISSKETMNLLSLLRLGVDLGMFDKVERAFVDELFLSTQPAHLQVAQPEKLDSEQRDIVRAGILRSRLAGVPW